MELRRNRPIAKMGYLVFVTDGAFEPMYARDVGDCPGPDGRHHVAEMDDPQYVRVIDTAERSNECWVERTTVPGGAYAGR